MGFVGWSVEVGFESGWRLPLIADGLWILGFILLRVACNTFFISLRHFSFFFMCFLALMLIRAGDQGYREPSVIISSVRVGSETLIVTPLSTLFFPIEAWLLTSTLFSDSKIIGSAAPSMVDRFIGLLVGIEFTTEIEGFPPNFDLPLTWWDSFACCSVLISPSSSIRSSQVPYLDPLWAEACRDFADGWASLSNWFDFVWLAPSILRFDFGSWSPPLVDVCFTGHLLDLWAIIPSPYAGSWPSPPFCVGI